MRPRTLDSALQVLADGDWQVYAGTTDIYPASVGRRASRNALDLTGIASLRGISRDGDHWRFGACTTWTDIATAELPAQFAGLQDAATQIGGIQIQNRGTVAGNLCTASPAGDSIPVFLSLSATVELSGLGGVRTVPLADFVTGYRETVLQPDEIVSAVLVPDRSGPSNFQKLGSRSHLVISIAMVATHLEPTADGPVVRIAVGACSPVAVRLRGLEAELNARLDLTLVDLDLVDAYGFDELSPIGDVRASADYRADVVRPLVKRSVAACVEELS